METNHEIRAKHPLLHHPPRADQFIRQEAIWNLTQNGCIDGRYLEVEVDRGVLVLKGEVATRSLKRLAQECVGHIPGIVHVENRLRIKRVSRFSDDHSMHGF